MSFSFCMLVGFADILRQCFTTNLAESGIQPFLWNAALFPTAADIWIGVNLPRSTGCWHSWQKNAEKIVASYSWKSIGAKPLPTLNWSQRRCVAEISVQNKCVGLWFIKKILFSWENWVFQKMVSEFCIQISTLALFFYFHKCSILAFLALI